MDQVTDGLVTGWLSLLVPLACICTVLFAVPISIVGLTGPTEIEVIVGFTKNPRQLAAKAKVASTAQAPISLDFLANMVLGLLRPLVLGLGRAFPSIPKL
jgi:hypothetical protein